ncbi:Site-specific DNA recombinase [Chryseobacterium sp. RU37D]|uniref:recombinase family protein n=1 Tax=Chryseobacterium sp. RU37D TaxID=1907397 RepID=UPI000955C15B|nr:recombinase family protein [Chryseobacterium sp. RU37D]SIQ55575.1 Site-specific DNA recombinase [Chryseobacterium sp. RU37D]
MLNILQEKHKKAVAYYRHSAEDKQENSIAIQRGHTQKFALEHQIEIIHEEMDEGKSGLVANRPGFERLFSNWIKNPEAPAFDYILVYDVSRWGRFQDQDEAAYFSRICTQFGKKIIYVSLGFPNDENSLISGFGLMVERYMASEYSRQLSSKVFHGSVKVSQQGFSAGGTAVYGMIRELLDINKDHVRFLDIGEHKQISNERVVFAPKNDATTETVRNIFHLFAAERYSILKIADHLNKQNIPSANCKLWDKSKIIRILLNEIYIGTHIYNRTWRRLKQKSRRNPRSEWVIVPDTFKAVIDKELFRQAQERLYWIFPSNWRKGINTIKRAKKNIHHVIFKWLLNKGVAEWDSDYIISELGIAFSIKHEYHNTFCWCFNIPEKLRKYDYVLCIGVDPNQKKTDSHYEFFLIPTSHFSHINFFILFGNSTLYHSSKIENNRLEETIKLLIKQFKNSAKRHKVKFQFMDDWL